MDTLTLPGRLLSMHVTRYSQDSDIRVPDIIKIMKNSLVSLDTWGFWAYSGYKSFSHKINYLRFGNVEGE